MDRWLTVACCALAVALATAATWQGPGLTDDSVNYLSTALNITGSRGALMLADQPLTGYPPALPALAAFGEAIGLGAETTLRLVVIASFGAIVLLGHRLLVRVVRHRGVVLGATFLLASSPALLGVSKMAWSEPPYIAVSLLFLLVLARVCGRGALAGIDIATLALLCWTAFLLRYIGLSFIAVGGIVLLAALRPLDRRTIVRILAFGALSLVGPVAAALRNHAADGTYVGNRLPSHDSVGGVAYRVGVSIGGWVLPVEGTGTRLLVWIAVGAGLVLLGGLLYALRSRGHDGRVRSLATTAPAHLLGCCTFIVVYVAYLGGAALNTAFEPLNSRYLSPVYVPLVVIGAAGVAALLVRIPRSAVRSGLGAALVICIALQLVVSVGDAVDGARDGIGWNGRAYTESEVAAEVARLAEADDDAAIYSNLPGALWAATGIQPLFWAPRDAGFRGVPTSGELEALAWNVDCRWPSTYVVLYYYGRPSGIGAEQMQELVDVEPMAVADDGAIFELTGRGDADCSGPSPPCSMDSVTWRCEGNRTASTLRLDPSRAAGHEGGDELLRRRG